MGSESVRLFFGQSCEIRYVIGKHKIKTPLLRSGGEVESGEERF
jgi:hypothetical protein